MRVLQEADPDLVKITFDEKDGKPWMWIDLNREKIMSVGKKAMGDFLRVIQ